MKDVLYCRDRTSGVFEEPITIGGFDFLLVDVGGQQIERPKWKKVFKDTGAIFFVVAISEV